MFGLVFGAAKIDAYRAEVIHTYLGAYHRTYKMVGLDRLVRTIQFNKLVSDFRELDGLKTFKIRGDLDDFDFYLSQSKVRDAQAISAYGRDTYQGFQVLVVLETGRYRLFMKNPTNRAMNMGDLFQRQYGAVT
jgi:hypothetical protein